MKNILFFGTGAVAAEFTSYLEDSDWGQKAGFRVKGYVASDEAGIKHWKEYQYKHPFFGTLVDYQPEADDYFVLALGNYQVKRQIAEQIRNKGGKFATLIHPTATIASTATIGEGNMIGPFTMLGPNVKLGDFNLLTSQSVVSHDSCIGNFNFLATALLCGHTTLGDDNYLGIRVTLVPEVKIGSRNVIQAGMILDKNLNDDETIFYRYKEKIIAIPKEK